MKKYKIGNRLITANSPIEAVKVAKLLDSDVVKASMKDVFDIERGATFKSRNSDDPWVLKVLKVDNDIVTFQTMQKRGDRFISEHIEQKSLDGFKRVLESRYRQTSSIYDAWTDVYQRFVEISNKYLPDTSRINSEITKLYSSHMGDSDWDEAYRRWFNIKSRDSENSEINYLTKEEERAVEDYRKAIAGTTNPKLLELYKHILDEELEHIRELENADVEDSVKDWAPPYAIWVKKNGKWLIFGGANSTNIDKRRFLNSGYEDVIVVENGKEPT